MPRNSSKTPPMVIRCLWYCRPESIDIYRDREEIITQVLNYGEWRAVKWLFKTYTKRQIKYIILHPRRGLWFKKALNFWLTMFHLTLPDDIYQRAIFEIDPMKRAGRKIR